MDILNKILSVRKPKSIFLGKVTRKLYQFNSNCYEHSQCYYGEPTITEFTSVVKREKIAEIKTDKTFEVKEEIYIKEINKYATIEKRTRGTDGTMVYNITYIIKIIEDEETQKSKEEAEILLKEELIKYEKYKNNKKKLFDETEKEEKERQIKEQEQKKLDNDKIKEIKEWQKSNLDQIKGIIINKINTKTIDYETINRFKKDIILNTPKEYIVIDTPFDTNIINISDNKEIIKNIKE